MATIKKPVMLKTPIAKAVKKPEKTVGTKVGLAKPKKGMEAVGKVGAKIGNALMGKK
jgi:hypothetical protein